MKILSTNHIMHPAGTRGVKMTKTQIVEIAGHRRELRFYHDYSSDSAEPYKVDNVPVGAKP